MIIALVFFLLTVLGVGLPLVLLISPRSNPFIKIGLSYPLGIGVFTILMFGLNLLGIKFSLLNESLLLITLLLPLILCVRKRLSVFMVSLPKIGKISKLEFVEKVILAAMLLLIIFSLISTLYWPVSMWDSVTLYDFRGRVFADTGFMKDALTNEYYYSYPLLTSLAHSIVYMAGGEYPEFIYSFFYLSLGVSFYGLLREFISRKASLFNTMLLLITGPLFYHSLFSYTNLTYTVYLGLGAIMVYLWDKKSISSRETHVGYLLLSALLVGFSTWVRASEPFWIAAVLIVLIVSIFRRRFFSPFIYFLIVFPLVKLWKLYQSSVAGGQVAVAGQGDAYAKIWPYIFDFANWAKIFEYLYNHVVVPWGPIFILFAVAIIWTLIRKKMKDYFLLFSITLAFMAVLVAGIFIFSVYLDYWYRIGDAIERLSMFFYPLFIFTIALVFFRTSQNK